MADVKKLSEGTVADATKELGNLSDADLQALHDAEHGKDDPRSTLLNAIHVEQDRRKAEGNDDGEKAGREARLATMDASF